MLSRQLEGIAKAKAEGKYRGGIPTARAKAEQVFTLVDTGKTRAEAAEELGNQHPKRLSHLADSQRYGESASGTAGHADSDTSASQRIREGTSLSAAMLDDRFRPPKAAIRFYHVSCAIKLVSWPLASDLAA